MNTFFPEISSFQGFMLVFQLKVNELCLLLLSEWPTNRQKPYGLKTAKKKKVSSHLTGFVAKQCFGLLCQMLSLYTVNVQSLKLGSGKNLC